jgi:predicted short-subunit dehydrogenase-like oxidoreductase (DUF2520 family)
LLVDEPPCYAAAVPGKTHKVKGPRVAIVGPGRLGSALAVELARAGFEICEVLSRATRSSQAAARSLARRTGARAATIKTARLDCDLIWFCVPDREIRAAAARFERTTEWAGKIAFHSSGALSSDELEVLRRRGAAVASLHPMMSFVRGSLPRLEGVFFAAEGDRKAVQAARRIVGRLGGELSLISKQKKAAYHAWGTFISPLLLALLVTAERVAVAAGVPRHKARRSTLPIAGQTLANYGNLTPARAFSGPIVRGDAATVRRHLQVLAKVPEARAVYRALARAALRYLPAENAKQLRRALGRSSGAI